MTLGRVGGEPNMNQLKLCPSTLYLTAYFTEPKGREVYGIPCSIGACAGQLPRNRAMFLNCTTIMYVLVQATQTESAEQASRGG